MAAPEVEVPLVNEIQPDDVKMSTRKENKWNWVENGEMKTRSETYALALNSAGQPLKFTLTDVRTVNGIQTGKKFTNKKGSAYMSINLTPEQSAEVKRFIDARLFDLCYANKNYLKRGNQINHKQQMEMLFTGIVKQGNEKSDGSGDRWPDQITANVPTKIHQKQMVVDEAVCTIEDLNGSPFSWLGLQQTTRLAEVVIEVTKIVFKDTISVRAQYRLITPDTQTVAKVTTQRKRQLQQMSNEDYTQTSASQPLSQEQQLVTNTPFSGVTSAAPIGDTGDIVAPQPTPKKRKLPQAAKGGQ